MASVTSGDDFIDKAWTDEGVTAKQPVWQRRWFWPTVLVFVLLLFALLVIAPFVVDEIVVRVLGAVSNSVG